MTYKVYVNGNCFVETEDYARAVRISQVYNGDVVEIDQDSETLVFSEGKFV